MTNRPDQPALSPAAARRHAVLERLSELGLNLARTIERRAQAAETMEDLAACADAFCRVARAVTLTIALDHRLEEEALARRSREPAAPGPAPALEDHRSAPPVRRLGNRGPLQ